MNKLLLRARTAGVPVLLVVWISVSPVTGFSDESDNHNHAAATESPENNSRKHHQHKVAWGEPGNPKEITQSIVVEMGDIYFSPVSIEAKVGDTIRFNIRNDGALVHEFYIGTLHMHLEHQMEMTKMMQLGMITATTVDHEKMARWGMIHDDANSVLLGPNKKANLVWKFMKPGRFIFACNVPGHYEAGMVGSLSVLESDSLTLDD